MVISDVFTLTHVWSRMIYLNEQLTIEGKHIYAVLLFDVFMLSYVMSTV